MAIAFILLCIAVIILGAVASKPLGWVVLVLAVLSLLMAVGGGGASIRIGSNGLPRVQAYMVDG